MNDTVQAIADALKSLDEYPFPGRNRGIWAIGLTNGDVAVASGISDVWCVYDAAADIVFVPSDLESARYGSDKRRKLMDAIERRTGVSAQIGSVPHISGHELLNGTKII